MTLLSRSDVVQHALRVRNERNALKKLEDGKISCKDFTDLEAEEVLENLRSVEENRERQKAMISIDHQKYLQGDYQDLWTTTLGSPSRASLKINGRVFKGLNMYKMVNRKIQLHSLKDDEPEQKAYYAVIPLTPVNMAAFINLRKKYQYFRINRIAVNFVSNSATNLSPILCKYIPPTIRSMQGDPNFYTKVAESAGTKEGYMSIHTPPCLMKQLRVTVDQNENKYYSVETVIPELKTGRLCCDYNENEWYLDYGAFYFETKNHALEQDIIMRVHYKIDFYTGYDYESYTDQEEAFPYNPYAEVEQPDQPSGGDDDGEDDSEDGGSGSINPNGTSRGTIPSSIGTGKRVPRNLLNRKGK